ncbi:MAG TPA: DNA replication and repair protein RecF [Solirubrobacterales bacterium]|nr:DNA replication and repair protein RecF [Solirubrobacterales bacterium]
MLVRAVEARPLRSLGWLAEELGPGLTSVIGPNGTGKTNLLEALYFALTGRSFRTGDRRELIPFGEGLARAEATVATPDGTIHKFVSSISRSDGRRVLLDGSAAQPADLVRSRPAIAVFSPDRLVLVKGPPAERRAHLDAFVGARRPARADLRRRFGQALAQRNALLSRVASGRSSPTDLDAWDLALAEAAAPLIAARGEAAAELAPLFAALAAELGLGDATLSYSPRIDGGVAAIEGALRERRESDLKLGRTGTGPHLDELRIDSGGRSLRRYGSQGQQRIALLALLFAEREALLVARGAPPLMLLDDVMSELDPEHRELLAARLEGDGQALISAADDDAVPERARRQLIRMPAAARRVEAAAA